MQDSRMMAEVVPPGDCAIVNVSGSRIATPLAPPRPGSTPMITPSTMPTNISARFLKLSATTKPCSSDWISSISYHRRTSIQAEQRFERALGQRHFEPDLEDHEENHAVADAHGGHLPPRVLAEPAHEEGDEQHRCDVDPSPADERDVDRRRDQHAENQLERADLDEYLVALRFQSAKEHIDERRAAHDQADVEREVARLRAVVDPPHAHAHAVVDDDRAQNEKERRDRDLGALLA